MCTMKVVEVMCREIERLEAVEKRYTELVMLLRLPLTSDGSVEPYHAVASRLNDALVMVRED